MTGQGWTLTSEALERLLAAIDPDRDRAAQGYERLRERLSGLLRFWGAEDAESLADATLDRVARKLHEGAHVPGESLSAYVRGVARMVFYESGRSARAVQSGIQSFPAVQPDDSGEILQNCFDQCLGGLGAEDGRLVLRYYGEGKASTLRRQLAGELGVTMTALRLRAFRIRERLERCVSACTQRG